MERIRRVGSDAIECKNEKDDDERVRPSMTEGEFFPFAEPSAYASSSPARAATRFLWLLWLLDLLYFLNFRNFLEFLRLDSLVSISETIEHCAADILQGIPADFGQ